MKIGFITDCIRQNSAGIGNYAKGFIYAMKKYLPNNDYVFIDYEVNEFNHKNILLVKNYFLLGKISLWYNYLPFALKHTNVDYIINFYSVPHLIPFKQKEIIIIHDLTVKLYPKFHNLQFILLNKFFLKMTVNNATKIIVNSNNTKLDLLRYYRIPTKKILKVFIPYLSNQKKKPNFIINAPYILNVNTIEPRKNIINLISAFEYLKEYKKIPHKLIIVGKLGWKYKEIIMKIYSSKYQQEILLTGYLNDKEKNYLYSKADVFIYPSFYEGGGIPILEAMLNACPVITSNISSTKEYAGNSAILVDPTKLEELIEAVNKVINSTRLRQNLINKGLIQINKINNQSVIKNQITKLSNFLKT